MCAYDTYKHAYRSSSSPAVKLQNPEFFHSIDFYIPHITAREHWLILIKSTVVVSSWIFSFFAIKHLPITIVAPIRATGPLWTLIGALLIFHEQLNSMQYEAIQRAAERNITPGPLQDQPAEVRGLGLVDVPIGGDEPAAPEAAGRYGACCLHY